MKQSAAATTAYPEQMSFSIRALLFTRGFDATLTFFCTLFVFSFD